MNNLRLFVSFLALCHLTSSAYGSGEESESKRAKFEIEDAWDEVDVFSADELFVPDLNIGNEGYLSRVENFTEFPRYPDGTIAPYNDIIFARLHRLLPEKLAHQICRLGRVLLLQTLHRAPDDQVMGLAKMINDLSAQDLDFLQRIVSGDEVPKQLVLPLLRVLVYPQNFISNNVLDDKVRLSENLIPQLVATFVSSDDPASLKDEVLLWTQMADRQVQLDLAARLNKFFPFLANNGYVYLLGACFRDLLALPAARRNDFDRIMNNIIQHSSDMSDENTDVMEEILIMLPHILRVLPDQDYDKNLDLLNKMFIENRKGELSKIESINSDFFKIDQKSLMDALYLTARICASSATWHDACLEMSENQAQFPGEQSIDEAADSLYVIFTAMLQVSKLPAEKRKEVLASMSAFLQKLPEEYDRESYFFAYSLLTIKSMIVNDLLNKEQLESIFSVAAKILTVDMEECDYIDTDNENFLHFLRDGKCEQYAKISPHLDIIYSVSSNAQQAAIFVRNLSNVAEKHFDPFLKFYMGLLEEFGRMDKPGRFFYDLQSCIQILNDARPDAWRDMASLFISLKTMGIKCQLNKLMRLIAVVPHSCRPTEEAVLVLNIEDTEEGVFRLKSRDLKDFIIEKYLALDGAGKEQVHAYWREILTSDNKVLTMVLVKFISRYLEDISLTPEMRDLFIRVGTLIDSDHESSPFVIYEKLLQKQKQEIQWDKLGENRFSYDEVYWWKMQYENIANFGLSMVVDPSSVPTFGANELRLLLAEFQAALEKSREEIEGRLAKTKVNKLKKLPLVLQATLVLQGSTESESGEVFCLEDANDTVATFVQERSKLLEDAIDRATKNLLQRVDMSAGDMAVAKMKCILKHLVDTYTGDERNSRLSELLMAWRFCQTGQNASIEEFYTGLPQAYKIKTKSGGSVVVKDSHYPALKMLHDAFQTVVSGRFVSNSSFLRAACRLKPGEDMPQASHQIECVRGLIGDKVGLCDSKLTFDIHGQVIVEAIRNISLQHMIYIFYLTMPDDFLMQLQLAMNRVIAETNSADLNRSLTAIHTDMKAPEDYEDWLTFPDEESFEFNGISILGMFRLLEAVGILKPEEQGN